MRLFVLIPAKLLVGALVILAFQLHSRESYDWRLSFFENQSTNPTMANNDIDMKSPDGHESAPAALFEGQSNGTVDTLKVEESLTSLSIQEPSDNRALMTALGVSPCASLGLGSNSTEEADVHDAVNESVLSHNVTMRKSVRMSNHDQHSEEDESDDDESGFSLLERKVASIAPSDEMRPMIASVGNNDSKLPKEVRTTVAMDVSNLMSPEAFRLSDEFHVRTGETNYLSSMANDEIAGLSPIIAVRESTISTTKRMSPSSIPVNVAVERDNRSVVEDVERSPSVSSAASPLSTSQGDEPVAETPLSPYHRMDNVITQVENEIGDKIKATGESVEAAVDKSNEATGESLHDTNTVSTRYSQEEVPSQIDARNCVGGTDSGRGEDVGLEDENIVQPIASSDLRAASALPSIKEGQASWYGIGSVLSRSVPRDGDSTTSAENEESCGDEVAVVEATVESVGVSMGERSEASSVSPAVKGVNVEDTVIIDNDEDSMRSLLSDDEKGESSPKNAASTNAESARKEPTIAYRDLTSAKKNLDASSMAFIERLRGAAHRRKLRVARSRDSLAAKEREHLLSIASANERRLVMAPKEPPATTQTSTSAAAPSVEPYKPFKARPAPSTTGHLGSGGQVGVPKIEKRPTTTPFSPLLGARRPQKEHSSSLAPLEDGDPRGKASRFVSMVTKSLTPKKKSRGGSLPFKARPAPPTTGIQGHGGQVGVPKIEKRPTTVPVSPGLGLKRRNSMPARSRPKPAFVPDSKAKREPTTVKPFARLLSGNEVSRAQDVARLKRLQQEADADKKARSFRARPMPKSSVLKSAPTSAQSPVLLGLNILNKGTPCSIDMSGSENVEPQIATPRNQGTKSRAYVPHSTIRAKKRASFDELRILHEVEREEEQDKLRKTMIKQQRKELSKLSRESLR